MTKLNLKKPKSFDQKVVSILKEAKAAKEAEKTAKYAKAYGMGESKLETLAYTELLAKLYAVLPHDSQIAKEIVEIQVALTVGDAWGAANLAAKYELKLSDLHKIAEMYKIDVPPVATEADIAQVFASMTATPDKVMAIHKEVTNEDRVGFVDELVRSFAEKMGLGPGIDEDGPTCVGGDMIACILHWVAAQPWMDHDPRKMALFAVRNGIGHYVAETYIEDAESGDIGPEVHVSIIAKAEEERWFADTFEGASIVPIHEEDDPSNEEE